MHLDFDRKDGDFLSENTVWSNTMLNISNHRTEYDMNNIQNVKQDIDNHLYK